MSMNPGRKFLFDANNFDLPDVEPEPEVYVEPPPIFSLEDMGHARDAAFEKGRAAGLEEARISREQYLAKQTDTIAQELKFLLGAEEYRAAVYEREVIALTETIFKSLFPAMTEREGLEEVKSVIAKVLANQPEQPSIIVELPEADAKELEAFFATQNIDPAKVTFKSSPDLARASCRMSWKDGGALRDHAVIAAEILKTLRPSAPAVSSETLEEPPAPVTDLAPSLANEAEKDETETDSPLPSEGE